MDLLDPRIRANWHRFEVTACRTKANRFFHVRCKQCKQFSYGQFGTWALPDDATGECTAARAAEEARDNLAKFFKLKEVPSGKPQV